MPSIRKSALVPYSSERMFELVTDVPRYPQFLPWCSAAVVSPMAAADALAATPPLEGAVAGAAAGAGAGTTAGAGATASVGAGTGAGASPGGIMGNSLVTPFDALVRAELQVDFYGLKLSFATRNSHQRPHRVDMAFVSGPFRSLDGCWLFRPLAPDACKVEFSLDYVLNAGLVSAALAPVFGKIAETMVDAFVRRAEAVHG